MLYSQHSTQLPHPPFPPVFHMYLHSFASQPACLPAPAPRPMSPSLTTSCCLCSSVLKQWQLVAMSGDILVVTAGLWHLVGRGQRRCWTSYREQVSLSRWRITPLQMSIVPLLRNPASLRVTIPNYILKAVSTSFYHTKCVCVIEILKALHIHLNTVFPIHQLCPHR